MKRYGIPAALSALFSVGVAIMVNVATTTGATISAIIGLGLATLLLVGWESVRAIRSTAHSDSSVDQHVGNVRGKITGWRGRVGKRHLHVRQRTGDVQGDVTGVDSTD